MIRRKVEIIHLSKGRVDVNIDWCDMNMMFLKCDVHAMMIETVMTMMIIMIT